MGKNIDQKSTESDPIDLLRSEVRALKRKWDEIDSDFTWKMKGNKKQYEFNRSMESYLVEIAVAKTLLDTRNSAEILQSFDDYVDITHQLYHHLFIPHVAAAFFMFFFPMVKLLLLRSLFIPLRLILLLQSTFFLKSKLK